MQVFMGKFLEFFFNFFFQLYLDKREIVTQYLPVASPRGDGPPALL